MIREIINFQSNVILFFLFSVLICMNIWSCKNDTSNDENFNEIGNIYFEKLATYQLPDSSFFANSAPRHTVITPDGTLYFTDFFGRKILQSSAPFHGTTQIGRTGSGPQEYVHPAFLDFAKGILYYSDTASNLIKASNQTEQEQLINTYHVKAGGSVFDIDDSLLVVENPLPPYVSIYEIHDRKNRLIQEEITYDDYHVQVNQSAGNYVTLFNEKVFFVPGTPYEITILSKNNNSKYFSVDKKLSLEKLPGVIPWNFDRYKQSKGAHIQKVLTSVTLVNRVIPLIKLKEEFVLLTVLIHPSGDQIMHLVNTNGEFVCGYRLQKMFLGYDEKNKILYLHDIKRDAGVTEAKIEAYQFTASKLQ